MGSTAQGSVRECYRKRARRARCGGTFVDIPKNGGAHVTAGDIRVVAIGNVAPVPREVVVAEVFDGQQEGMQLQLLLHRGNHVRRQSSSDMPR